MKSSFVLLLSASTLVVGCAGTSPLAPDAALASSPRPIAATSAGSGAPRSFLPPINPAGISCPSDAPQIAVSSLGLRMDIEFSEVAGANTYEIEIFNYYGEVTRLVVPAPAHRVEWYGTVNFYSVRVRTQNCGGTGNWSAYAYQALLDGTVPPAEPPIFPLPSEPELECVSSCEPPPPPPVLCMTGCF
jgi:hypothetical protein